MTESVSDSLPRSTFVTVLAWVSIILSGFGTLIGILQNVMFGFVMGGAFNQALQDSTAVSAFPPGLPRFMFGHFRLLLALTLMVSVVTLLASVGLLKRQNWARIAFVVILGLGAAYSLLGIILPQQFPTPSSMGQGSGDSTFQATVRQFDQAFRVFKVVMMVISLAFAALFAWLASKLLSARVRSEFVARDRAA